MTLLRQTKMTNKETKLSDRTAYAFKLIPDCEKLLDVGCGSGDTANEYFQKAKEVYGVDIKKSAIEQGKKKFPNIHFFLADDEKQPFNDNFFDVAVMTDVFEHVRNEKAMISEAHRVLKQGGTLVFSVPGKGLFGWIDPFNLKFTFPKLYTWWKANKYNPDIYKIDEWHRHYSLSDMKRFFEGRFKIEHIHRGGLLIYPLTWLFNDMIIHKFPFLRKILIPKIMWFFFNLDYKINYGPLGYHLIIKALKT